MATNATAEQLRTLLASGMSKRIRLGFMMDSKSYTTEFDITSDETQLKVLNPCIKIAYEHENSTTGLHPYTGSLLANSAEKGCFTPTLVRTDEFGPLDVLQILKTKIALLFPMGGPLCITDVARKGDVFLSSFNIVRGGNAVYEKYGYESVFLSEVKGIVHAAYWDQFFVKQYLQKELVDFIKFVNTAFHTHFLTDLDPAMRLTDIMKQFPIEYEQSYYEHQKTTIGGVVLPISDLIVIRTGNYRAFIRAHGSAPVPSDIMEVTEVGRNTAWLFCLNPEKWLPSDARMVFTSLAVSSLSASSSRKRMRRTRRRQSKRTHR
jgi:hypothetical protein